MRSRAARPSIRVDRTRRPATVVADGWSPLRKQDRTRPTGRPTPTTPSDLRRSIFQPSAVRGESAAGADSRIRATWSEYSAAFQLRYWLSHVALDGGTAAVYHGATNPPAVVLEAIDGLRHEVDAIARLRADEEQVLHYRESNGQARL